MKEYFVESYENKSKTKCKNGLQFGSEQLKRLSRQ